jgi:hypothetical protein
MFERADIRKIGKYCVPDILPIKKRAELIKGLLEDRLGIILPLAMKDADIDMWIILCQEDNLDPIYRTMIPLDCWSPILQMLIFIDQGNGKIEKYNVSGTDTKDLYQRPYIGQLEEEQWAVLLDLVKKRDPRRIGINIGSEKWCGGGLTHNLYQQLKSKLPEKYSIRLVSAEEAAIRWSATLTDSEINIFQHVIKIAHYIIAECFSRETITPGVTTVDDLKWHYWQNAVDLGLDLPFNPHFNVIRNETEITKHDKNIILPGDVIHCDVGIKYLRLNSDNQHLAYVLKRGETDAPAGLRSLMTQTNQLQEIFMDEFKENISGNELQQNILKKAHREGILRPRIYSHSLGLFLHQPGPLIGLPWEQENPLPRGKTLMKHNYAFAMELSSEKLIEEWHDQNVRFGMEEAVIFTKDGCHTLNGRQAEFYLI